MADNEGVAVQQGNSVQAESSVIKKTDSAVSSDLKSAPVSVIQSAPPRTNGVHEESEANGETNGTNHTQNGTINNNQEVEENKEKSTSLDIHPPSEQLPAELLQEEASSGNLTTVASLVEAAEEDQAQEPVQGEKEEAASEPEPAAAAGEADKPEPETAKEAVVESVEEDKKEEAATNKEEEQATENTADQEKQSNSEEAKKEEATESKAEEEEESGAASEEVPANQEKQEQEGAADSKEEAKMETPARKSGRPPKPSSKKLESAEMEQEMEESVAAIAAELERTKSDGGSDKKKSPKKNADGEGDADKKAANGSANGKKIGRPKKKDLDEKVEHVTKLGNNMYFYTGPGGEDSPPPLHSDEEDIDESRLFGKKEKEEAKNSRTSNRAGKGRNPRLERDDEEIDIPNKKKPNLNPGWLKQAAKNMTPKNSPGAKKKAASAASTATPKSTKSSLDVTSGGEEASPVPPPGDAAEANAAEAGCENDAMSETSETSSVSSTKKKQPKTPGKPVTPPRDEELPEFDPAKFKPGYVPAIVKKGSDEYMIVVGGVQNTGLCGKYWGELDNLPPRRRSKAPESFKAGESPEGAKRRGSVGSTSSTETPSPKRVAKKQDAPLSNKKQITIPAASAGTNSGSEATEAESSPAQSTETPQAKKRGRKRKDESDAATPTPAKAKKLKASDKSVNSGTDSESNNTTSTSPAASKKKSSPAISATKSNPSPDKINQSTPKTAAAVSAALAAGVPGGQQRSVSCVADTSTQKEVVVECFAPYDDHRWVNIGKERDGMSPDAVQYARALRPPYHLLSFLRIKGHSTKGMSCTDKNTMVFVVLEGEITVILHTTQFNAKKGDSFYIPPKNYYNLINQKAREAELSLIQFQYDGPLPTVNPPPQVAQQQVTTPQATTGGQ